MHGSGLTFRERFLTRILLSEVSYSDFASSCIYHLPLCDTTSKALRNKLYIFDKQLQTVHRSITVNSMDLGWITSPAGFWYFIWTMKKI